MSRLPGRLGAGRRARQGKFRQNCWSSRVVGVFAAASAVVGCHMVPLDVAAPPVANLNASPARTAALETGRLIFTGSHKCARCHRPKPIVDYTLDYWKDSVLPRMAKKANLSEVEEQYLMAYIQTAHNAIPARRPKR